MQSKTNETTAKVLAYLFTQGVFCWRQNTQGTYDQAKGIYRPAAKKGVLDILAVTPPTGQLLCVEIKTGRDRLRAEQVGFIQSVQFAGGRCLVVKDYEDFLKQYTLVNYAT